MKHACSLLAAALVLASAPSDAQASAKQTPRMPVRIRATIEKLDNNLLTVKTDKGDRLTLELTPKTNITGVDARTLADIKPPDFVGVTASLGSDQRLHAMEVHIFPESLRGLGEGHFGAPDKNLTNATVAATSASSDGETLTLNFVSKATGKTESTAIEIARTVPVVAFVPGDAGLLKPGTDTMMLVAKEEDGDLIALGIVAEKDGVKPPQ